MCNIGKFFRSAFMPGSGAAEASGQIAIDKANEAALAQKQAQDQAKAAADSESETNKLAAEARMRKILSAGAFGAVLPMNLGAPTLSARQLFGA